MNILNKERLKDIFITILVGAFTAFVTVFLEGALEYFRGLENNIAGGATASIIYALKHLA